MPELAEVELARRIWTRAEGEKISSISANHNARIFRELPAKSLNALKNLKLLSSLRHGKRMYFTFEGNLHLEVHLGMSGKVFISDLEYEPRKHDHLLLYMQKSLLILNDYRMFGKVSLHEGLKPWETLSPDPISRKFTRKHVQEIIEKRGNKILKGALLDQNLFPGLGNWMVDEICWRLKAHPGVKLSSISAEDLYQEVKTVCTGAIKYVVEKNLQNAGTPDEIGFKAGGYVSAVPPKNWLFQHRWTKGGHCPRCKVELARDTIATRTTAWCPSCQKD